MSRSATVAIAYLMRYQSMSLIEAFRFVRECRPCISPNPGFMRQLVDYEKRLYGRVTLDVQRYEDDRFGDIKVGSADSPSSKSHASSVVVVVAPWGSSGINHLN